MPLPPLDGGGPVLNAATWINHPPLEASGAVALYDPAEAATMSSTISAFGCVMTCFAHPVPAPVKLATVMPAANSNSLVWPVLTGPLSACALVPEAEANASKGLLWLNPEYSVSRRSTSFAGWSNVTVTVLLPDERILAA